MNSLERKYAEFDLGWLTTVSRAQRAEIVKMTVLYLMRAVTSESFSETVRGITGWTGRQMAAFRSRLKLDGYLQRDFKFYLYEAAVNHTFSLSSLILKEDREFVQRLLKATDDPYSQALLKQCKAYKRLGYKPVVLKAFTRSCNAIMGDLTLYCRKFVIKSLRFLVKSDALAVEDYVQELIEFGVYAIYRAYPEVLNELHMLNIAKQAAHNRGENIIKESTTQSRAKLARSSDGTFYARQVSLNSSKVAGTSLLTDVSVLTNNGIVGSGSVMVCSALMVNLEGKPAEGESVVDVDRSRDLREAVNKLYEGFTSPKARKFMELLMGVHDPEFSDWLGKPNEEVCDQVGRVQYAESVRQYLEVPVEKASLFVKGLRKHLQDFRN